MAITQDKIEAYNELTSEKHELNTELKRIDGFFARDPDNKDNGRAINAGKILVKYAGTACMLPTGVFTGALHQRKNEIEQRLSVIETELETL